MRGTLRLLLVTLASLFHSPAAEATIVRPLSLPDLVARADRIAVVRVESQQARWTKDQSAIYTEVTVRVEQAVKGELREGDRVTVLREGGEVGEVGMLVPGAPGFTVGEEALLFLERRGQGTWTVGMALGKLGISLVDGRRVVKPDLRGLTLAPSPANRQAVAGVRPLDEVLRDIASLLPGQERRR